MDINLEIKKRKDSGLFRKRRIVTSPQGAQIDIKGKSFLNFSSNDYLGLANNNKLKLHMVESIKKYGVGSGLIPPFSEMPNKIDESIARTFGRFPVLFRGGLGAPRRQIRILEIGKLEGLLEKNLRNLKTRQRTINLLANEIVQAFLNGTI